MLDNHAMLAVSNDTHLIPSTLFGQPASAETPLTSDLFEQMTNHKYFERLGIDSSTASQHADRSHTFAGFVSSLFDEYARNRQKPLAGEKVPAYVRRLPLIHRLFPAARVIHIIRDGRDVALSTLEWVTPTRYLGKRSLWEQEPVAVCALWWHRQVSRGIEGAKSLGDRYLELRYEALVSDPESALRTTCEFLEVPFDAAMLRYHEGREVVGSHLSSKDRWLPPTSGIRDWRTSLAPRDLQLFEALAGDLLQTLGYPLSTIASPSADTLAKAERCKQIWRSDTAPRSRSG